MLSHYPKAADNLNSQLVLVQSESQSVRDSLRGFADDIVVLRQALSGMNQDASSASLTIRQRAGELQEAIAQSTASAQAASLSLISEAQKRAAQVLSDLDAADKIAGRVIDLLRMRLADLNDVA